MATSFVVTMTTCHLLPQVVNSNDFSWRSMFPMELEGMYNINYFINWFVLCVITMWYQEGSPLTGQSGCHY